MYKLLIIDKNAEIEIKHAKAPHPLRTPLKGEYIMVQYQGVTKICEVEDVWTNLILNPSDSYQGAVQVIIRWGRGMDPAIYVRRFK